MLVLESRPVALEDHDLGKQQSGLFTAWYTYQNATVADFQTSLARVGGGTSTADGLQGQVDRLHAAVAAALAATE